MTQPATKSDSGANQTPEELRIAQIERNQALIALLNSWEQDDPQEQRDTLAILVRALQGDA